MESVSARLAKTAALHAGWTAENLLPRRRLLASNAHFRDLHRGKRCFILGSGKSIVEQDLKPLHGELVITQNNFHVHADIATIAPAYHCVVPMFHPPKYAPDWLEWFRSMDERMPKTTHLFAGLNSRALLEKNGLFDGRRHYVRHGLSSLYLRRAAVDLTRVVMEITTALTQCLELAIFLGCTKIYLLGFDMTQLCEGRDRDWGRFYGTSPVTRNEAESAFDDDFDWDGDNYYHFWKMWRGFALLRSTAEARGSEIVNATRGGLLNCFRRERYEDLIAGP